jgi:RNase P/RNase MRP subunit p29
MANALQLRRGTTTEHGSFTGLAGEITVDTTKNTIVVHDGSTPGGAPLAKEAALASVATSGAYSDLTGTPSAGDLLTQIATVDGAGSGLDADTLDGKQLATIESEYQAFANSAAAAVVDAAPATLDTLNELAAALGDDPNFATTVTNSIATKASLSGATFTGAVAGTDLTITGDLSVGGSTSLKEIKEFVNTSTSTSGTLTVDVTEQGVVYLTSAQTADRTINLSNADSAMDVGESLTVSILSTQGATAYYFNAYQVDGGSVTPMWQGGDAPIEGNASGIDAYTFTLIKTAASTFTVLASQTQFA